jgi:hypothetical protein
MVKREPDGVTLHECLGRPLVEGVPTRQKARRTRAIIGGGDARHESRKELSFEFIMSGLQLEACAVGVTMHPQS